MNEVLPTRVREWRPSKEAQKLLLPYSDGALVAGGAAHARLDAVHGDVLDVRGQVRPDEHVEADADQLLVRDQGELLAVRVERLGELLGPRLGVLGARVHDVLGVEVDHLLEAEGVYVDPLIVALVVCRGWMRINIVAGGRIFPSSPFLPFCLCA